MGGKANPPIDRQVDRKRRHDDSCQLAVVQFGEYAGQKRGRWSSEKRSRRSDFFVTHLNVQLDATPEFMQRAISTCQGGIPFLLGWLAKEFLTGNLYGFVNTFIAESIKNRMFCFGQRDYDATGPWM